jgi:hypothetical protein
MKIYIYLVDTVLNKIGKEYSLAYNSKGVLSTLWALI